MPTLLLRLEAPMQSYGVYGRFGEKDTGKEPSKSAVIGLICSALGIDRSEDISWLTSSYFGVRIDREGIVRNDYHIAGIDGIMQANGKKLAKNVISNRYYLADASFLVGIETKDRRKLEKIQVALKNPKWQIFLGKKSFVPTLPVWIKNGIKDKPLMESLIEFPFERKYLTHKKGDKENQCLRYVVDKNCIGSFEAMMISKIMDVPISFEKRLFGERETATLMIDINVEEE